MAENSKKWWTSGRLRCAREQWWACCIWDGYSTTTRCHPMLDDHSQMWLSDKMPFGADETELSIAKGTSGNLYLTTNLELLMGKNFAWQQYPLTTSLNCYFGKYARLDSCWKYKCDGFYSVLSHHDELFRAKSGWSKSIRFDVPDCELFRGV